MRLHVLLTALALLPASAFASTLTYTETFTASGFSWNGDFHDAVVTLSATGNTAKPYLGFPPVTVTIAGLGSATFTDPIEVVDLPNPAYPWTSQAGFYDPNGAPYMMFTYSSQFDSYDLTTPILVTGQSHFTPNVDWHTSSGRFRITSSAPLSSTFQAVLVNDPLSAAAPEPSSLLLLATGMAGAAGLLRRQVLGGS